MTSFATHRLRVHDATLPVHRRMSALRTCLTQFAPYGLRATFHHLRGSAGIPRDPARDPDSLVRAVEELQAAREVWVPGIRAWQAARRIQKRAGVRLPHPPEPRPWVSCPNLEFHPLGPLAEVMPRILRAREYTGEGCAVCEAARSVMNWSDGHRVYALCTHCGVERGPSAPDPVYDLHRRIACAARWGAVWRGDAEWERPYPPRA
ncbi:hypothetical protein [Streptomyces sp. NBC_01264]|uniref:hypothetical protein n=1 Tax=Streptomyces sp. NBC_01264 TaxID=2903804 RepID=UPI002254751A|nr:hypothetical protein [Streptomyces sp. NBC_01264]MCX4777080.1 hypothetical protein [Streptomyces sp. NBC_01264]